MTHVRGCTGKKKLPSMSKAQSVARRLRDRRETNVEAYHCKGCGGFHVGYNQGTHENVEAYKRRKRELAREPS